MPFVGRLTKFDWFVDVMQKHCHNYMAYCVNLCVSSTLIYFWVALTHSFLSLSHASMCVFLTRSCVSLSHARLTSVSLTLSSRCVSLSYAHARISHTFMYVSLTPSSHKCLFHTFISWVSLSHAHLFWVSLTLISYVSLSHAHMRLSHTLMCVFLTRSSYVSLSLTRSCHECLSHTLISCVSLSHAHVSLKLLLLFLSRTAYLYLQPILTYTYLCFLSSAI